MKAFYSWGRNATGWATDAQLGLDEGASALLQYVFFHLPSLA